MSDKAPAEAFIQWKGTDVCLDFRCFKCRHDAHFDGDFAYRLICPVCGTVYVMPSVVALKVASNQDPDESRAQMPRDPDLMGDTWAPSVREGGCKYYDGD